MEIRCATPGCAYLLQLLNVTSSVGVTAAVLGGRADRGELNKTAIATLVERTTRYTMLVHLPEGHNAEQVRDGLVNTIMTLPAHLRGSLTWDQGEEMARHQQLASPGFACNCTHPLESVNRPLSVPLTERQKPPFQAAI